MIANYNPIPQFIGLPTMPDLTQFADDSSSGGKTLSWGIYADYTNFFAATDNTRETAIIDGESYRYSAQLSFRIGSNSLIQFRFPYNYYLGGGMDSAIESWHRTFSLPEGGREEYPRNLLRFYYRRDNRLLFDYKKPSHGAVDSTLRYVYRLSSPKQTTRSVFLQAELPTGDKTEWRSNGHTDVAFGWAVSQRLNYFTRANSLYYDFGLLLPGKLDKFGNQQTDVVGFGALGFAMAGNRFIQYKAQLDLNTPIIRDSNAQELGGEAAQLTLGGDILLPGFRIEIGVAEDLVIDASPDVTFHFAIASRR